MTGMAPVDLSDPDAAKAWVEEAAAAVHGRIDVVYNNASSPRFVPMPDLSVEDWQYGIRNELDLVFYVTKFAWPYLAERGGVIINTASISAHVATPDVGMASHCAAKGGVLALTRVPSPPTARSTASARVSISPGPIKTPGAIKEYFHIPGAEEAVIGQLLTDRVGLVGGHRGARGVRRLGRGGVHDRGGRPHGRRPDRGLTRPRRDRQPKRNQRRRFQMKTADARVVLVGSLPFGSAEETFRAVGRSLNGYIGWIPDGEFGERKLWTPMLPEFVYSKQPDLEETLAPPGRTVVAPPAVDGPPPTDMDGLLELPDQARPTRCVSTTCSTDASRSTPTRCSAACARRASSPPTCASR